MNDRYACGRGGGALPGDDIVNEDKKIIIIKIQLLWLLFFEIPTRIWIRAHVTAPLKNTNPHPQSSEHNPNKTRGLYILGGLCLERPKGSPLPPPHPRAFFNMYLPKSCAQEGIRGELCDGCCRSKRWGSHFHTHSCLLT